MTPVNLAEKLATFDDCWNPRIVGELNGQQVKLVKLEGEFVWHHHDRDCLRMQFHDHEKTVERGEFIIVPRGVEHRPVAEATCHVMLFEPASTLNTGNVSNARTINQPQRI